MNVDDLIELIHSKQQCLVFHHLLDFGSGTEKGDAISAVLGEDLIVLDELSWGNTSVKCHRFC